MILADTSVWIDHFRANNSGLVGLLTARRVITHDHVLGELALGSLKNRKTTLEDLANLPRAALATEEEVRAFIEARQLFARGIGYTDAHLLASAALGGDTTIWTRDLRLAEVADELAVAYQP